LALDQTTSKDGCVRSLQTGKSDIKSRAAAALFIVPIFRDTKDRAMTSQAFCADVDSETGQIAVDAGLTPAPIGIRAMRPHSLILAS
jgi:hypothetical protein